MNEFLKKIRLLDELILELLIKRSDFVYTCRHMVIKLTTILIITFGVSAFGQSKQEVEVVTEGNKLFKSEMASWYGTDIFVERFPKKRANTGGYFSFVDGDKASCIFFSQAEIPKVLAKITFDSTYNVNTASVDSVERELTTFENDLYYIRKVALKEIQSDTLFKKYNNTDLNFIPISDEKGKRLYVMTGPKKNGVVLFGNDYLIEFDRKGDIKSKTRIHKSLIPIEYGAKDGKIILSSIHSHLPGYSDYITATDICTLRLYQRSAKWEQHIVISNKFVSLWDCRSNKLLVFTKEAWDKIYERKK